MTLDSNGPLPDPSTVQPEPEGSRWARAHHMLLLFVAIGVIFWLFSGFYVVAANEVAIVEHLGQYVSVNGSGPHYCFPWPVDIVHKIPISKKLTLQVNEFSNISDPAVEEFKHDLAIDPGNTLNQVQLNAIFNPYLVTGDKNMLNVSLVINYQIDDARKFLLAAGGERLFNPEEIDPETAIKPILSQAAARVLNRCMGAMHVDDALTERRDELVRQVTAGLQEESASLGLGIEVLNVSLNVAWPPAVAPAFARVPEAKQEKQQRIEQATGQRASKIASANGEASRLVTEAKGYGQAVVDAANGEKARFEVILAQYEHAGVITTQSLFSDAMTTIMKNVGSTYVVQDHQRLQLILPPTSDRSRDQTNSPAGAEGGQR